MSPEIQHKTELPVDPFDGFFESGNVPEGETLPYLDFDRARNWLDVVGWGVDVGLYTYQQPFTRYEGARGRIDTRDVVVMSSYDYLGLIGHPALRAAAVDAIHRYGTSTGGVRLLTGTTDLHRELEEEIAVFKGVQAAVGFSSGYLANFAALTAFAGPGDTIVLDDLAHRSLIEAARLSRARVCSFRHNDPDDLDRVLRACPNRGRRLVATEGVFSMDGDLCRLPEIVETKSRHGAILLVDEAHSLGVTGKSGRGVHEHFGIASEAIDLWTGSLSKAIASNGGYVAGRKAAMIYLQHEGSSFMFSAALAPAPVAASLTALRVINSERWRVVAAQKTAHRMRTRISALGFDTCNSDSPVIPVVLGNERAAWRAARDLLDAGYLTTAIVPPAVPRDTARLRVCATAAHNASDVDGFVHALSQLK